MPVQFVEHVDAGDAVLITRTFRLPVGATGSVNPQTMTVYRAALGAVQEPLTPELSYSDADTAVTAEVLVEFPVDSPSGRQAVVFVLTGPIVTVDVVHFGVQQLPAPLPSP